MKDERIDYLRLKAKLKKDKQAPQFMSSQMGSQMGSGREKTHSSFPLPIPYDIFSHASPS